MRNRMRMTLTAFAAMLVLAAGSRAYADEGSLSDSIEKFLNDVEEQVKNAKIGPVNLRPSLRESIIWTDNVFLNDTDERGLTLKRLTVVRGSQVTVITDRSRLNAIARATPDFSSADTRGRVSDELLQSQLTLGFEMPVNEEYTKAFKKDRLTLLEAEVKNQEYFDENRLDNTSINLRTDIFSFVSDLFSFESANEFWVRGRGEYSKLTDPLDAQIRLINDSGITTVDSFNDFQRTETTGEAQVGWKRNRYDAMVGYEYYSLDLDDKFLRQAEHQRQTISAEVGTEQDFLPEKRLFARYDLQLFRFGRAPVLSTSGSIRNVQVLNDADVHRFALGAEGLVFSRRISARVEAGYMAWRSASNGLSGDTNQFNSAIGKMRVAYKPWEERKTQIQLEYQRTANYSAISNFNTLHEARLTYTQELTPRQLDLDVSLGFTRTDPSDGPSRKLYEAGAKVTYHAYKQLDVTLSYQVRLQRSMREIVVPSAFVTGEGGPVERLFEYELSSNGDFLQNVIELGVELKF